MKNLPIKAQEEEKIRYKTRPIRMAEKTWETLKRGKIKYGKSWNLFLLSLLEKNGTNK